jgi:solute carrier family 35 protein E3
MFNNPQFKREQVTFAALHFGVTGLLLFVLSRPKFRVFEVKKTCVWSITPLAAAMCFNVIMPNLSLQFSSVAVYQVTRILLTPTVACINWLYSRQTIPKMAALALAPACLGVGIATYYDRLYTEGDEPAVMIWGVLLSFMGVLSSSVYTVMIARYHDRLKLDSMQLLFNQVPVSVLMLFYIIPFTDDLSIWTRLDVPLWGMIFVVRFASY